MRLFLLFLILPTLTLGQIVIKGNTKSKSENIYFAHITFKDIDGNTFTTISNENSEYKIELKSGTYQVKATYIGYNDFTTDISLNTDTTLDIVFEESSTELSEVTVQAISQKTTDILVVKTIRDNNVVSDGISTEFIKRTPDRNAGDALKRVSGVTIQNDKFVLVRGLADRYNSALLNKTLLKT